MQGFILIIFKHKYPEWLVLEVGAGKPGDIKSVAPWLSPDIVVITAFPDRPVHIEFFGTVEKIIEEKSALAFALKKDGLLVLNHDDEKVYALHKKTKNRTISYGFNENATYKATHPTYLAKSINGSTVTCGINFKLEYNGNTFPVMMPHIVGMHYVSSALIALSVAHEIGCDLLESVNAISDYMTPPGRLSLLDGVNDSVIIDDTYNASPIAMEAAIEVLKEMKGKRKIAVLGDMLELGKLTQEAHTDIGAQVVGVADILVTVGPRAKFIASGAQEKGFPLKEIYSFDSYKTAGNFLQGVVEKGDVVLLKGSQGVRLERAVEAILAHPELKKKLLCRQEKEWQNR
jgi:UDP-N-acetylmuramoyl-tripeptide--D-alanyl-D-alanine ligase